MCLGSCTAGAELCPVQICVLAFALLRSTPDRLLWSGTAAPMRMGCGEGGSASAWHQLVKSPVC